MRSRLPYFPLPLCVQPHLFLVSSPLPLSGVCGGRGDGSQHQHHQHRLPAGRSHGSVDQSAEVEVGPGRSGSGGMPGGNVREGHWSPEGLQQPAEHHCLPDHAHVRLQCGHTPPGRGHGLPPGCNKDPTSGEDVGCVCVCVCVWVGG